MRLKTNNGSARAGADCTGAPCRIPASNFEDDCSAITLARIGNSHEPCHIRYVDARKSIEWDGKHYRKRGGKFNAGAFEIVEQLSVGDINQVYGAVNAALALGEEANLSACDCLSFLYSEAPGVPGSIVQRNRKSFPDKPQHVHFIDFDGLVAPEELRGKCIQSHIRWLRRDVLPASWAAASFVLMFTGSHGTQPEETECYVPRLRMIVWSADAISPLNFKHHIKRLNADITQQAVPYIGKRAADESIYAPEHLIFFLPPFVVGGEGVPHSDHRAGLWEGDADELELEPLNSEDAFVSLVGTDQTIALTTAHDPRGVDAYLSQLADGNTDGPMRSARAAFLRSTPIVALSAATFRNKALHHARKNGVSPDVNPQRVTRFCEATISNDLVRAIGAHQFGSLPVRRDAPQRVPIDEARQNLRDTATEIADLVRRHLNGEADPPVLLERSTAGTGKSAMVAPLLADLALAGEHRVHVYSVTHKLLHELWRKTRREIVKRYINSEIAREQAKVALAFVLHVYGASNAKSCANEEIRPMRAKASELGIRAAALCENCPLTATCRTTKLAALSDGQPGIFFVPAAFLKISEHRYSQQNAGFIVIEEDIVQLSMEQSAISVSQLEKLQGWLNKFSSDDGLTANLKKARDAVAAVARSNAGVALPLRATMDALEAADTRPWDWLELEARAVQKLKWIAQKIVNSGKSVPYKLVKALQHAERVKLLASVLCKNAGLLRWPEFVEGTFVEHNDHGVTIHAQSIGQHLASSGNAPVLVLDATADLDLLKIAFGAHELQKHPLSQSEPRKFEVYQQIVAVDPNTTVIAVPDRHLTERMIMPEGVSKDKVSRATDALESARTDAERDKALDAMPDVKRGSNLYALEMLNCMLAAMYEAPAVITQKAARMLTETKCAVAEHIGALLAELANREPEPIVRGHCNAERGSNRMEHCDVLTVAGRTKMSPLAQNLSTGAVRAQLHHVDPASPHEYVTEPAAVEKADGSHQLAYRMVAHDKWGRRVDQQVEQAEFEQNVARIRPTNPPKRGRRAVIQVGTTNSGLPVDKWLRTTDVFGFNALHVMAGVGVVLTNPRTLLNSKYAPLFAGLKERGVKKQFEIASERGTTLETLPGAAYATELMLGPAIPTQETLARALDRLPIGAELSPQSLYINSCAISLNGFGDLIQRKKSETDPELGVDGSGGPISGKFAIPLPPRWVRVKFRLGAARRGPPMQALVNITKHPNVERALGIVTGAEVTMCEIECEIPVELTAEQRAALGLIQDGVKPAPTVLQQRLRTLAVTGEQPTEEERRIGLGVPDGQTLH